MKKFIHYLINFIKLGIILYALSFLGTLLTVKILAGLIEDKYLMTVLMTVLVALFCIIMFFAVKNKYICFEKGKHILNIVSIIFFILCILCYDKGVEKAIIVGLSTMAQMF